MRPQYIDHVHTLADAARDRDQVFMCVYMSVCVHVYGFL
jgi:hypothetical protein